MKPKQRLPLSLVTISTILITVVGVISLYAVAEYQHSKSRILEQMHQEASSSAQALTKSLAPFIESYATNEYLQLLDAELEKNNFLAILVSDFNMSEIFGGDDYISGKVRNPDGKIHAYKDDTPELKQRLTNSYLTKQSTIYGNKGDALGRVTIYVTDQAIQQQLRETLYLTLYQLAIVSLLLVVALTLVIRRILTLPLARITHTLQHTDATGIPLTKPPSYAIREFHSLSQSMGQMIDQVETSRHDLEIEHKRLNNVLEGMNVGSWEWNLQTGECRFNERWAEIVGYALSELQPTTIETWMSLAHPDDLKHSEQELNRYFNGETAQYDCEARMRHKNGDWVWVLDRGRTVAWDDEGQPLWMAGTHLDITERKNNEEVLRQGAQVFRHANEGIMITNADSIILDVNDAFTDITGYSREEILGKTPQVLKSGRHDQVFYQQLWSNLVEEGHWTSEVWNRRKDGQLYAVLQTISAIKEGGKISNFVSLFTDITKLKKNQEEIEYIAHYDPVTGLANRTLMLDRLQQAMKHATRNDSKLCLVFIDLDGFKQVNDNYGHHLGDELLAEVASRMQSVLRDEDTLARVGGDEFVAVLGDIQQVSETNNVLERLQHSVSEVTQVSGKAVNISASIGVSIYPQAEAVGPDQLLRQADQAMYHAKQNGKNHYRIFDTDYEQKLRSHHEELTRIAQGLERGEFITFYQPKVNMKTGQVVGFEALIRWQHPERGILPPAMFLPRLENDPLMITLGDQVITQVLNQLDSWNAKGIELPVSINIDGSQLAQANFVQQLAAQLAKHPQLKPWSLELEILETSALQDIERASRVISQCKDIGVTVSLDDFGTGYSTLTYLKRLPVSTLKIDKSFVIDMQQDIEDLTILDSVIGLSDAFQRITVAEGVETEEHGTLLLSLGCTIGQGYGIAHPMPAEQIPAWIEQWQPPARWLGRQRVQSSDIPILFAMVEHRIWVQKLEKWLHDLLPSPPELHPDRCAFGNWLQRFEQSRHTANNPCFAEVKNLHSETHQLGKQLVQYKKDNQPQNAEQTLRLLHQVKERLITMLDRLMVREPCQHARNEPS